MHSRVLWFTPVTAVRVRNRNRNRNNIVITAFLRFLRKYLRKLEAVIVNVKVRIAVKVSKNSAHNPFSSLSRAMLCGMMLFRT